MTDLLVIAYEDENAAEKARDELTDRADDLGINLLEALVIRRDSDGQLTAPEPPSPTAGMKKGAMIGGVAGLLLGGVGAVPGAIIGTALGGLVNAARGDFGISETVREETAEALVPGSSALLLLGSASDADAVSEILSSSPGRVIRTSIADSDLRALEEALTKSD